MERTCPHGGDLENNCYGCVYAGDYMYDEDTEECVRRPEEEADMGESTMALREELIDELQKETGFGRKQAHQLLQENQWKLKDTVEYIKLMKIQSSSMMTRYITRNNKEQDIIFKFQERSGQLWDDGCTRLQAVQIIQAEDRELFDNYLRIQTS